MLAVAAVVWPVVLLAQGIGAGGEFAVVAAALAIANTAVGVATHRVLRAAVRATRARSGHSIPHAP